MHRLIGLALVLTALVRPMNGSCVEFVRTDDAATDRAQSRARLVRILQDNAVTRLVSEATAQYRPRTAAFVDVNLVSVRDGVMREHQTVVVRNGRFVAVGNVADVRVPRDAVRIDGAGKYLVPGMTDMHIHSLVSSSQKLLNLANGVTTVRDMDGFPFLLAERDAIRANRMLAPTMYVTGTILNAVPMENYARVVTSPDEARIAVRSHKRAGYDFIKIHNLLPLDLYRAVLDESRRRTIDVVGHLPHDIRIEDAIRLGQRTLEHFKGYYLDSNLKMTTEDYVGLTKGAEIWNCPTLYTRRSGIARRELEQLIASSDEMRYVPAAEKQRWLNEAKDEPDPTIETIYERSTVIFKELIAVRARILTGTDSGGGYRNHVPGFSLQHELELMESLGMTPADILRSSTIEAAAAMRREREFGAIEVGLRADCILASKNPMQSVSNLSASKGVMVRGIWLSPDTIAALLARLAAIYENDDRLIGESAPAALQNAVRDARELRRLSPFARVGREDTLVSLGDALLEAGMTDVAVSILGNAVTDFPDSAPAHAALAEAAVKRGALQMARAEVERAFACDPGNARARRLIEVAPVRTPPSFAPSGSYALHTRMMVNGAFKPVQFTLDVTGSAAKLDGQMRLDSGREFKLENMTAAGNRLWATAVDGQTRIGFRLSVRGSIVRGSWSAGFGGGDVTGRLSSIRSTSSIHTAAPNRDPDFESVSRSCIHAASVLQSSPRSPA